MRMAWILANVLCCIAAARAGEKLPASAGGLDAEVHAAWTRVPLRTWATRASTIAGRPVILDRRIDPEFLVTLTARGEPLRAILDRVAAEAGGAVEELESTVRIVPTSIAGKARVADTDRRLRVAKASASARRILESGAPWSWPPAARPRDLVRDLADAAGLDVAGIDTIPHDHFPSADLPTLALAERFDLVLAHFDRRVVWTTAGSKLVGRIIPIDAELDPDAVMPAKQPRGRAPSAKTRPVEVRDEFTLRLEAPLDQTLMAISRQLDLEVEIDRESLVARGVALGEIVRADVQKVSRAELFDAILHPLGLAWRLDGTRLEVYAPDPGE